MRFVQAVVCLLLLGFGLAVQDDNGFSKDNVSQQGLEWDPPKVSVHRLRELKPKENEKETKDKTEKEIKDLQKEFMEKKDKERKEKKADLDKKLGYDQAEHDDCMSKNDDPHMACIYEAGFTNIQEKRVQYHCYCEPSSNAVAFGLIDLDQDDRITKQETKDYFDGIDCVFPFKYELPDGTVNTYDKCTTDADINPWCATKTHPDGHFISTHWKYCDDTGFNLAWDYAILQVDSDGDGEISFTEVLLVDLTNIEDGNIEEGTNRALSADACPTATCTDLLAMLKTQSCGPQSVKTVQLGDETLLRILADAMVDVYCDQSKDNQKAYQCPIRRAKIDAERWLTREAHGPYGKDPVAAAREYINEPTRHRQLKEDNPMVAPHISAVESTHASIVERNLSPLSVFDGLFRAFEEGKNTDGTDAIQWALYNIERGEHIGKTVLAYMGSAESEQFLIDVILLFPCLTWKTGFTRMSDQAIEIARILEPDFVTGHSLAATLTEVVTSETGIPGAAFAPLGVFGKLSCNNIVTNNTHHNVPFEVVMNENDVAIQFYQSGLGREEAHIACGAHHRTLDFSALRDDVTVGHSGNFYATESGRKYWISRRTNHDGDSPKSSGLTFLPDQEKFEACRGCFADSYCESDKCIGGRWCASAEHGNKIPTLCPFDNKRGQCYNGGDCASGRCEWDYDLNPIAGACYDTVELGGWCNEDSDCDSGRCELFRCTSKGGKNDWCSENNDCKKGLVCKFKATWTWAGWVCQYP